MCARPLAPPAPREMPTVGLLLADFLESLSEDWSFPSALADDQGKEIEAIAAVIRLRKRLCKSFVWTLGNTFCFDSVSKNPIASVASYLCCFICGHPDP